MTRGEAVALVQRIMVADCNDATQASAWLEELGRSLGCTAGHVDAYARGYGRRPLPRQAELVRMHATGGYNTISELMEVSSIGRATVYRVLHRVADQKQGQAVSTAGGK